MVLSTELNSIISTNNVTKTAIPITIPETPIIDDVKNPRINETKTKHNIKIKKNKPIPNCPMTDSPQVFLNISLDLFIESITPLFSKIMTGIMKNVANVHAMPTKDITILEIHPSDFLSKAFIIKPTVAETAAHMNIL